MGDPKEEKESPKGHPKEGQERPKRRPGERKRAQGTLKSLTFWGSQASKKHANQEPDFSKTELSFESGAHFERGGAKGRPRGAQKVHREPKGGPSKAQMGAQEGQREPKGRPREAQGKPRGAQRSPREPQVAHFLGVPGLKKRENQKRAFSKPELSFENGAHF